MNDNSFANSPLTFDSVAAAHDWVDQWVADHRPVRTATALIAYERDHVSRFHEEFGRLSAYYDVSFDILVGLVEEVNYVDKSTWPQHRALQFMMLSHNMKAFVSSMDRLSRGYYEDAIALARGPYETFARLVFISCYPAQPWGAIYPKAPKGYPAFDLTGFLRDRLRLDWSPLYSTMSVFAHSNALAVIRSVERNRDRKGEPEVFGLTFDDDENTLGVAAAILPFVLLAYTRFVVERMIGRAPVRNADLMVSAHQSIEWLTFVMATNKSPLWQHAGSDLNYIFSLLDVADNGGSWKKFRAHRPVVEKRQPDAPAGGERSQSMETIFSGFLRPTGSHVARHNVVQVKR